MGRTANDGGKRKTCERGWRKSRHKEVRNEPVKIERESGQWYFKKRGEWDAGPKYEDLGIKIGGKWKKSSFTWPDALWG